MVARAPHDVSLPLAHGTRLFDDPGYVLPLFQYLLVNSNNILPATSVDVERIFSRGRLILSHVRSRLSAQSTRALLCLGSWSSLGLVKDTDVLAVAVLDDVEGNDEYELKDGWDDI